MSWDEFHALQGTTWRVTGRGRATAYKRPSGKPVKPGKYAGQVGTFHAGPGLDLLLAPAGTKIITVEMPDGCCVKGIPGESLERIVRNGAAEPESKPRGLFARLFLK